MKHVVLNNGIEMPILGFGVYQIADDFQCEQAVLDALQTGYRLIDTAAAYMNEEAVGRAIRRSGIPREEIFIITKLWIQDAGYESAKKAFEKSLRKLGLDYLDLYLIHQPYGDVYGAWRAMEELYRDGQIRAIGVSNFQPDRIMDFLVHNPVAPAVNQIEIHPFFQQNPAQEFLRQHNIQAQSWGPFAEGKNDLFRNELLAGIGARYGKSIAQIVLRWLIQRQVVVIPKSVHKDRMVENFNVFDFRLTEEDMQIIQQLDLGRSSFLDHRDPETVRWLSTTRYDL